MPIILKIRLKDFVTFIHFDGGFLLSEGTYISYQQVGECVPRSHAAAGRKLQFAIGSKARLRYFVFLCDDRICSELEIVSTDYFGDVVTERVSRVRVQRAVRNVSWILTKTILSTTEADARYTTPEAVVENSDWQHARRPLPGTDQVSRNVIGGITCDKFIQECRRCCRSQSRDHAYAWTIKIGLYGWKRSTVSPKRDGIVLHPRIMNITERTTNLVAEIVIDLEKFFAPICRQSRRREPLVCPNVG